jgi:ribosome biogenesis protein SSF1/2
MKDYTAVAGQLGVSHILALSQTKSNVILRIGRHADGPTLHFKVNKYSLSRQVKALQKRPFESPGACKYIFYRSYVRIHIVLPDDTGT